MTELSRRKQDPGLSRRAALPPLRRDMGTPNWQPVSGVPFCLPLRQGDQRCRESITTGTMIPQTRTGFLHLRIARFLSRRSGPTQTSANEPVLPRFGSNRRELALFRPRSQAPCQGSDSSCLRPVVHSLSAHHESMSLR